MSLHKCSKCGRYTMKENCPYCKAPAVSPVPPRFSLEHAQKYSKYRRMLVKRLEQQSK
ncbi:MAG: H/ACA ribonucleoprotein complex subunit NOP10 [Candidatus Heimdallarchaeota archaeon]|nr:MAG: ribosome biogenesis protein [Candidatus Gerdarchaeota archaeon]